ncbi:MAG: Gfo/Idh/MocA family oxidoreductase [Candidatus Niyogibacteria bacterium]|nr:Gfo/Idh/MocA family oxidoreductase [Candidatus Niyogibacteria bacterium]
MKIGLIGFGSIGQRHYKNLQKYSKDITVLTKRKDVFLPNIVKNWRKFLNNGPFDVIFIANETHKHIPTIKKCISLEPRAIFVEKPLSHDTKELRRVETLLRHRKISLWVGYCLQFYKPLLRIKKIIQSKKLGKIYYMRIFAGGDLRAWRKRDYRGSYSAKKEEGGGVMLDLVHDINYPAWILNDILMPKSAFAGKISKLNINSEDLAETVMISKNKGVVVSVHQDYLTVPGGRICEIGGAKGTLRWNSADDAITILLKKGFFKEKIKIDRNDMYERELDFFFRQMKRSKFFTNLNQAIADMFNVEYLKKLARI